MYQELRVKISIELCISVYAYTVQIIDGISSWYSLFTKVTVYRYSIQNENGCWVSKVHVARKPVHGVFHQVWLKPTSLAMCTGYMLLE